jgi:protein-tyrosine phosphatase
MLKNDPDGKVYKFLSFGSDGRDIADPWYTGNFDVTYRDVMEGCETFFNYLLENNLIY